VIDPSLTTTISSSARRIKKQNLRTHASDVEAHVVRAAALTRDQVSRSASVSARRSNVARRNEALRELAHFHAQTTPVPASAPFVGQKHVFGSVESSLREIPARATRLRA
jgi:hypothetical protein